MIDDKLLPDQRCFNKYCEKLLTEEDIPIVMGSRMNFGQYHLCEECWAKFDGQKMRGRFRMLGMTHNEQVKLTAQLDQINDGGKLFELGHPSDEQRYTESMDEWIEWQKPEVKE